MIILFVIEMIPLSCKMLCCLQVRIRNTTDGRQEVFEIDPDEPYKDTLIISSQPGQLDDYATGLNDVKFWVKDLSAWQDVAIRVVIDVYCNRTDEPWCEPSEPGHS